MLGPLSLLLGGGCRSLATKPRGLVVKPDMPLRVPEGEVQLGLGEAGPRLTYRSKVPEFSTEADPWKTGDHLWLTGIPRAGMCVAYVVLKVAVDTLRITWLCESRASDLP